MSAVFLPWIIALILCIYAVILARKKQYPQSFSEPEQKKVRKVLMIASAVLIAASLYRLIEMIANGLTGGFSGTESQGISLEVIGASLFLIGSVSYMKGTQLWHGNNAMLLRRFGYLCLIIFIVVAPGGFQVLLPLIIILSVPWAEIAPVAEESVMPGRKH